MNTWRDFRLVRVLGAHVVSGQRTKEERMRNRYVTSLLTLGAVAVFLLGMAPAAEAELICKKIRPSGPKVCFEASTGSVVCDVVAQGVAAQLAKYCDGDPENPFCWIVIECGVYGTVDPNPVYDDYTDCLIYDANGQVVGFDINCLINGSAVCLNPDDHYNANGTAFNLPGPLTSEVAATTCEKSGGVCTGTAIVQAEDLFDICNNNWTLDFTPYEFLGELSICPGGFDTAGDCCSTNKRSDGICSKYYQANTDFVGQPGYLRTYCTLNEGDLDDNGNPKKGVPYKCIEVK
jgi:hypothetical protein